MFTVKWYTNETDYRCLSVEEFEVSMSPKGQYQILMVFPEGKSWNWEMKPTDKVYLLNKDGKTIDCIRPITK